MGLSCNLFSKTDCIYSGRDGFYHGACQILFHQLRTGTGGKAEKIKAKGRIPGIAVTD